MVKRDRAADAAGRHRLPRVLRPAHVVAATAVVLILSISIVQFSSTSAAGTSLRVDSPSRATVGQPFQISLWLTDASSVAGYEAEILFDTEAATFRGLEHRTNELARMGRDVQTIGPDEIDGGFAIGAYSCSFAHCVEIAGLPKQHRGGSGVVRLVTLTIVPHQAGPLTIEIGSPMFVDVDGTPLEVDLGETVMTVQVEGS